MEDSKPSLGSFRPGREAEKRTINLTLCNKRLPYKGRYCTRQEEKIKNKNAIGLGQRVPSGIVLVAILGQFADRRSVTVL